MPRKIDHLKARSVLSKLTPDTLQAITVRLPASLLLDVHAWAEQNGLDLASAIRELTVRGRETIDRPGQPTAADRKAIQTWRAPVERALRAGQSPIDPFLAEDAENADENSEASISVLPLILARLDYQRIYQDVVKKRENAEPWVERAWNRRQEEAPDRLKGLMKSLDSLEEAFRARKKLYFSGDERYEQDTSSIHWLFSEDTCKRLEDSSAKDADIANVQKLISARYLVQLPQRPWEYAWDE